MSITNEELAFRLQAVLDALTTTNRKVDDLLRLVVGGTDGSQPLTTRLLLVEKAIERIHTLENADEAKDVRIKELEHQAIIRKCLTSGASETLLLGYASIQNTRFSKLKRPFYDGYSP